MQTAIKGSRIPGLGYNSSEQTKEWWGKSSQLIPKTILKKTQFRSDFKWTKWTTSERTRSRRGQWEPWSTNWPRIMWFMSHMFHYLVFGSQVNFCSYIVDKNYLFFIQMNATDLKIKHKKFCHSPKKYSRSLLKQPHPIASIIFSQILPLIVI